MGFNIGTTTIGKSNHTLGLDIISKELRKAGYDVNPVKPYEARHCDILLVSLYWVDQVIEYPNWLIQAKIDPAKRKPVIIIGGSMVLNPWPIDGMFHYAVLGDGEVSRTTLGRAGEGTSDVAKQLGLHQSGRE